MLLDAYLAEFSARDDVLLVLRVSTDERNKEELARWLVARACSAAASAPAAAATAAAGVADAGAGAGAGAGAAVGAGPNATGGAGGEPRGHGHRHGHGHDSSLGGGGGDGGGAFVPPLASCPGQGRAWRSLPPILLLDAMLSATELLSL